MAYYVRLGRDVFGFATKKDALRFAMRDLKHEHQIGFVYKDSRCKEPACTVQYMGWGITNYYSGSKLEWGKEKPKEVKADGTVVYRGTGKVVR